MSQIDDSTIVISNRDTEQPAVLDIPQPQPMDVHIQSMNDSTSSISPQTINTDVYNGPLPIIGKKGTFLYRVRVNSRLIPRPMTTYLAFAKENDNKQKAIELYPDLPPSRALGEYWREMSDEEREPYKQIEATDTYRVQVILGKLGITPDCRVEFVSIDGDHTFECFDLADESMIKSIPQTPNDIVEKYTADELSDPSIFKRNAFYMAGKPLNAETVAAQTASSKLDESKIPPYQQLLKTYPLFNLHPQPGMIASAAYSARAGTSGAIFTPYMYEPEKHNIACSELTHLMTGSTEKWDPLAENELLTTSTTSDLPQSKIKTLVQAVPNSPAQISSETLTVLAHTASLFAKALACKAHALSVTRGNKHLMPEDVDSVVLSTQVLQFLRPAVLTPSSDLSQPNQDFTDEDREIIDGVYQYDDSVFLNTSHTGNPALYYASESGRRQSKRVRRSPDDDEIPGLESVEQERKAPPQPSGQSNRTSNTNSRKVVKEDEPQDDIPTIPPLLTHNDIPYDDIVRRFPIPTHPLTRRNKRNVPREPTLIDIQDFEWIKNNYTSQRLALMARYRAVPPDNDKARQDIMDLYEDARQNELDAIRRVGLKRLYWYGLNAKYTVYVPILMNDKQECVEAVPEEAVSCDMGTMPLQYSAEDAEADLSELLEQDKTFLYEVYQQNRFFDPSFTESTM